MECGKLTAKLRDAVQVIFIDGGREVKRYRNIEIPDEIKMLPYSDFKFDVPEHGPITFKLWFEPGVLPLTWPENRERNRRGPRPAASLPEAAGKPQAEPDTQPDPEPDTEDPEEPANEIMEVRFDMEKNTRKELALTLAVILNTPARYMGVATKAYQVGEYMISADGTLTGPRSAAVLKQLNERGF